MNKFFWSIRVYYEDTDAGGLVYHANYLKFFERARTEMLRAMGFGLDELQTVNGVILAVRSLSVEYLQPARFNTLLQVSTAVSLIKKASFSFDQTIMCGDELLCTCSNRIACLDAQTLRPKAIPAPLLRAISKE